MDEFILSVTQLNNYVEDKLYSDSLLFDLRLRGELSGVSLKYTSAFFSMKDENALVECIIPDAVSVPNIMDLQDGETIIARGSITLYKKSGRYRFLVRSFSKEGQGDLYRKLAELKEKLAGQGVFDPERKKSLPAYPARIGIVTSASGAALQDIINIAARRNNTVGLTVYSAHVQGEGAPYEIAEGIRHFNRTNDVDLIIVARGGGSSEDLSAFNAEEVVLAVYNSRLPVVSAVGHEIDFTLCDFAADVRVPTPSAAAELCIPSKQELLDDIRGYMNGFAYLLSSRLESAKYELDAGRRSLNAGLLQANLEMRAKEITFNRRRMYDIVIAKMEALRGQISEQKNSIELLNPYEAFRRGYALVRLHGVPLESVRQAKDGDELSITLKDGQLNARVLPGGPEKE
jgi:exodeoxyribonuclease VII large subunit